MEITFTESETETEVHVTAFVNGMRSISATLEKAAIEKAQAEHKIDMVAETKQGLRETLEQLRR